MSCINKLCVCAPERGSVWSTALTQRCACWVNPSKLFSLPHVVTMFVMSPMACCSSSVQGNRLELRWRIAYKPLPGSPPCNNVRHAPWKPCRSSLKWGLDRRLTFGWSQCFVEHDNNWGVIFSLACVRNWNDEYATPHAFELFLKRHK